MFGWVAANYASGALQGYALRQGLRLRKPGAASAPFVGVFELGGASAQVPVSARPCVNSHSQKHPVHNACLPSAGALDSCVTQSHDH